MGGLGWVGCRYDIDREGVCLYVCVGRGYIYLVEEQVGQVTDRLTGIA